jgi:hypothetical protein
METRLGKIEQDIDHIKKSLDTLTCCLIGSDMTSGLVKEHHTNCERIKDLEEEVNRLRSVQYAIAAAVVLYLLNTILQSVLV